jgi:hypothetical protein
MPTTTDTPLRRCIGSTRFGIEAHDADPSDFPVQPSQKDGLGRMCHTHWRRYTNALRKAAVARKTEASTDVAAAPEPEDETVAEDAVAEPEPPATPKRRTRKAAALATGEDAQPDEG